MILKEIFMEEQFKVIYTQKLLKRFSEPGIKKCKN